MRLSKLSLERYKGYGEAAEVEFAPLTVLVGANNSGKTALAQAVQLLAGSLAPSGKGTMEPIPLESGGIRHGATFEDLLTGRNVHGRLRLSADWRDEGGELEISATVGNVVSPTRSSERHIFEWRLRNDGDELAMHKSGFDEQAPYKISVSGSDRGAVPISWHGLIPEQVEGVPTWVRPRVKALEDWATHVRHLQCPRRIFERPFIPEEHPPAQLGSRGGQAPHALAADDELRKSVRDWYRGTFGVSVDVVPQGIYSELVTRGPAHGSSVRLAHSGRGLSQVLPVAVMALTARSAGPGVDIVEHPEAELHPAAHGQIADLLIEHCGGPDRPLVIETHSEMVLLRARRWVAEGRMPPEDIVVYWIEAQPGRGSILHRILINERGEMERWPDGVFIEDYEEILAIRRAARARDLSWMRIEIDARAADDPDAHRWLNRILYKIEDGWHVWDTTCVRDPYELEDTMWFRDPGSQGDNVRQIFAASIQRSAWSLAPHERRIRVVVQPEEEDELTPEFAARLAEEPMIILVENRVSDGAFVKRIVADLDKSLNRAWYQPGEPIRIDSPGGSGQLSTEVDRRTRGLPYRPRLIAIVDSDRKAPGDTEDDAARKLRQRCESASVPCWVLAKREAENYLPRILLDARPGVGADHARQVEAWDELDDPQKDFFDMKNGLSEDLSEIERELFEGLSAAVREILRRGFGRDVHKCWELWNVQAGSDLCRRGGDDLDQGLRLIRREV